MGGWGRIRELIKREAERDPLGWGLLLLTMGAGLVFGLASPNAMQGEAAEECGRYIGAYLELLPPVDWDGRGEFLRAAGWNISFVLAIVLFSLHVLGAVGIAGALFYRCYTLGFALAFLSQYQSGPALLIIILSLLPQNLLFLPLLLFCACRGLDLWRLLWQDPALVARERNRLLLSGLLLTVGCGLGALLAAAIQAWLSPLILELLFLIR